MDRVIDSEYAIDLLNLEHAGFVCFLSSILQAASAILISLKQSTYRKRWLERNILLIFYSLFQATWLAVSGPYVFHFLSAKTKSIFLGNCVTTDGDETIDCPISTYTNDIVLLFLKFLHILVLTPAEWM